MYSSNSSVVVVVVTIITAKRGNNYVGSSKQEIQSINISVLYMLILLGVYLDLKHV